MRPSTTLPRLTLLWSYVRPYRGRLLIGLVLGLLLTGTSLVTPMVTKWVLDSVGDRSGLSAPITWLLALLVAGTGLALTQWILLGTTAERVVLDARTSLVRRFLTADVADVTGRPAGELVTRVTSDTELLRTAASSAAIGLINAAIGLVGTLVLMAVLDLVLLGITLGVLAVVLALFATLMPTIARAQAQAQASVGQVGAELEGALRAVRTVKASRAEQRQEDRIVARATESARHSVRAVRATATAWSITWSGIQLAIIVVLGVGALRVDAGVLPVSSLIAFLLYSFNLIGPLTELSQNVTALQSGLAAAERIRETDAMRAETDRTPVGPAPAPDPSGPVLELRGVGARYGSGPAVLTGIDLAVPRRGHLALVGPSGAGKTTLFNLLLRFLEPSEGELRLDGRAYRQLSVDQVRARLAYVEQDAPLVPGSLRENVMFSAPDADPGQGRAALRAVGLEPAVAALEGGWDAEVSASTLSGGQRQRVAVARALVQPQDVLLLDEATAQVDGITEAAVQRCIRAAAEQGVVITIAHRLSTVLDADLIVVLEDGRIRARGRHRELLASDQLYRELVEALRIAEREGAAVPAG